MHSPVASKVAPLFQGKKGQRASAVVSIFDESSREGSENSQDNEQFRARREFLKSGLPDSFRKQIAKTAATREAYSLSCSSFQTVVHVLQTPQGKLFGCNCIHYILYYITVIIFLELSQTKEILTCAVVIGSS